MKTNNKGFSLVELIVVIAIMAILAAVAIPTFAGFITKANKASDDQFLNDVEYAVQIANAGNPTFEAGAITVAVEGDELTISYGDVEITEDEIDSTDDVIATIASSVDWDFTFKYYNDTATITDGAIQGTKK